MADALLACEPAEPNALTLALAGEVHQPRLGIA
jgi:hypothetical protein